MLNGIMGVPEIAYAISFVLGWHLAPHAPSPSVRKRCPKTVSATNSPGFWQIKLKA